MHICTVITKRYFSVSARLVYLISIAALPGLPCCVLRYNAGLMLNGFFEQASQHLLHAHISR